MIKAQLGEQESCHKKYSKISLKKRQLLIEMVVERGESLTKTSKKLNIKLSTAKLILRKYRKTGEIFHKNMGAKIKKNSKEVPKESNIATEQIIYKNQQLEIDEVEAKVEGTIDEAVLRSSILTSLFYPTHSGNWIIYPGVIPYGF